ncbi:MAG: TRAP transporter DctQ-like membrane protein [Rhodospirillaceae bacterium]|nr:MAG: TRAP transporter DctQ-like membrane protein [Rhodospirillaceae bacterium]
MQREGEVLRGDGMKALAVFVHGIDRFNDRVGRLASWLVLGIVGVCFAVVVLRYGFGYGRVWMQDLYVWLHAMVFTTVAGRTLLKDGHVRVDIFYRSSSVRRQAWVDLTGTVVFLIPYVVVLVVWSWDYVVGSWAIGEGARNTDGLPTLYLLKSFLFVFGAVVGAQGLAMAGRSLLILLEHSPVSPAPAGE